MTQIVQVAVKQKILDKSKDFLFLIPSGKFLDLNEMECFLEMPCLASKSASRLSLGFISNTAIQILAFLSLGAFNDYLGIT